MTPHTSWATPNCPASVENAEISRPHRRTARSLSFSHASAGQLSYMRRRSSATSSSAMVSLEDYDRLPASIKRKFFSSTERLHIAQQSAKQRRRRKLSIGQTSFKFSHTTHDDHPRPATSGGITRRPSRRGSKEPTPTFADISSSNITAEQAHWYLSLPDKIRKQQFTRREQVTFALQCKRALEETAPDYAQDALRRCLKLGREEDSTRVSKEKIRRPSAATVDTDILLDDNFSRPSLTELRSDSLLDGVDPVDSIVPVHAPDGYKTPVLRATKSMVDLSLPPSSASSTPSTLTRKSNSISLRRKSHSHLTPLPLPPPQLAPPLPQLPPAFSTLQHATSMTSLPSGTVEEAKVAAVELRPDSRHHQQPDVRKQLRQWLTPEKFDEALEFGFAFPNPEIVPMSPTTNQSSPQQPPPLTHTDDEYSEEDGRYSLDNSGPMTPTTAPEQIFPTAKKPSFDSSADLSYRSSPFSLWNRQRKHGPVEIQAEREMTVRVTLTRRDLRAPGDPVYGVGRIHTPGVVDVERVDPLALEAIPVCDDPTGAHGAFAVSTTPGPKGLKKVWKALRRH